MEVTKTMTLRESNHFLTNLIKEDKPFTVLRLGSIESTIALSVVLKKNINMHDIFVLGRNAGIYCRGPQDIIKYGNLYNLAIKNADGLSCFEDLCASQQNIYIKKHKIPALNFKVIEPFYSILENIVPWSYYLKDKRILIINPFVDSFKEQQHNNFKIFKNKNIFHPDQKFIFYKAYNTAAGNHLHSSWLQTFNIMCNDIEKIDFDIALLGCGGYGLPLCNFIKTYLNKSAIYIGGGLQLLFGVMGKRWENTDLWKKIIKENNCKFIRPNNHEKIQNSNTIEGGCYW
jgi:hypothetical protein